ncbi:MAG: hypothetical protein M3Q73_00260 [bacterium]|nr:hypothetical protein [bacterium]
MSFNKIHIVLGILVILVPIIGLPPTAESVMLVVIGIILIGTSLISRIRRQSRGESVREDSRSYVENSGV